MRIRLLDAAGARQLYESRMARDFPPGELKPFAAMEELLAAGLYEPLTFTDDAGAVLAYAWQVVLPGQQAGLVDYFAVRSDLRGSGIGTRALHLLQAHYAPRLAALLLECECRTCCWNVSILPRPPTPPLRGGASGFTCGPGHGLRRWKAGCSVRGTAFCSCPAARHCCLTAR